MESIFVNVNIDDIPSDDKMDQILELFSLYATTYKSYFSNSEYLEENKQIYYIFYKDTNKIFKVLKNELEEALKEGEDDSDSEDYDDFEEEIRNILNHINIIIDEIPNEEYINTNSINEIKNKMNQPKLKESLLEIEKYFNKINENIKKINESMKKCTEQLDESMKKLEIILKITNISSELDLKQKSLTDILKENNYLKLKEDIDWIEESLNYLGNLINENNLDLHMKIDINEIKHKQENNMLSQDDSNKLNDYNIVSLYNKLTNFMAAIKSYMKFIMNKLHI